MRVVFVAALAAWLTVSGKSVAQEPGRGAPRTESTQDLIARLTPEQKQRFDKAAKDFDQGQFAEAIPILKELLGQLAGDAVLTKFASEAALNIGDSGFALSSLRSLTTANPNDWQAAALLTRACAESGDGACRDTGIAHMAELHKQGVTPAGLRQYIVERIPVGENMLVIQTSLEPWGRFHVYNLGQVLDKQGNLVMRITLESDDADQGSFAQQHPKEAAAGMRRFSYDGYGETAPNASGQRAQTHSLYEFADGLPPYAAVRKKFLEIAGGKSKAMTGSTHP
jgi:hypothetical protein